ncbi:MAG TPA: FecR domain-containing protein [Steroidobacteraceae bacterium]|jgi:transmembrane sensor
MSTQKRNGDRPPPEEQLGEEAADWLLHMESDEVHPGDGYTDTVSRDAAFREWCSRSPRHLQMFLETCEADYQTRKLDPQRRLNIQVILENRTADVIALPRSGKSSQTTEPISHRFRAHWLRNAWAAAAAVVAVAIGVLIPVLRAPSQELTTALGEQRTAKLSDGSMVYMNTDTRIAVDYSGSQRNIRLLKGEALFVVEHDPQRPFIVSAQNARVRAVGTQFNVRDRADSVDVAVVEGVVQVTASDTIADSGTGSHLAPPPLPMHAAPAITRVSAGEIARVTTGRVIASHVAAVTDAISWRDRRLIFHNATLGEVASELNRYNRTQIKVDLAVADKPMFKTAVFDADRPQALILYASREDSLSVEPDGDDWVIRARGSPQ